MIINIIIFAFIIDYLANDKYFINKIINKINHIKTNIKAFFILYKMKKQVNKLIDLVNENTDKDFWS